MARRQLHDLRHRAGRSGQPVAIPTEIEAVVDSADLTQTPPVLSIAGQDYTLDKIKRGVRTSN
jgi:flagellar basal-body rod modification protein FlgD